MASNTRSASSTMAVNFGGEVSVGAGFATTIGRCLPRRLRYSEGSIMHPQLGNELSSSCLKRSMYAFAIFEFVICGSSGKSETGKFDFLFSKTGTA